MTTRTISIIRPRTGIPSLELAEVWRYRELLGFLAWRDILVRYKQTAIGVAWALVRPLVTVVVFTVIFGKVARLPAGDRPYALLTFAGILPWQYFATAFSDCASSVVGSSSLVSRVYFPRLIIPLSSVVSPVLDFAISLGMFSILMAFYGVSPTRSILWLPVFFLLAVVTALGAGIWFAALHVRYRDVRHLLPFIIQLGIFVSPVGFRSSVVDDRWRALYSLNPLVGVIDGFRWSLLGGDNLLDIRSLIVSCVISLALLISGLFYFRRTERTFADLI